MAAKVQGAKNRRAAQMQDDQVINSVKGLNLDSVSKSITETQVEVQRVLADLSARVMERLQELEQVQEAIQLKQEELQRLHQIEVTATKLDELEAQINEQRRAWEEEQAQKKRDFAEQQSERNKAWAREENEYQYRLAREHLKQTDDFKTLMAQQERQNRDQQQQLEKTWAEREGELKKREQELAELRAFKEQVPDMIKKEVNKETIIASNSIKKEYEAKAQLNAKDFEMEKRLAEQQVQSLQQTTTKQQAQIDDLKAQLEHAHRQVVEISAKALDSASGRATSDALQRLMEKEQSASKPSR
jgi:hypothetical protein